MSALPKHRYTLAGYLELDQNSDERYEFFDGEVVARNGGKIVHGLIAGNIIGSLQNRLAGKPCRVLTSDVRVRVPKALPYRYADVSIVCGEIKSEELGEVELLLNPVLIVEVLSKTTEAYDRGEKFLAYQSIESFREYLLVAQDRPHVTHYVRQASGQWLRTDVAGPEAALTLPSLDCTLTLGEIYCQITFQPRETN
jgi:Uma2 family endonuclease